MPRSLAPAARPSDTLPRDFGRRATAHDDRWPVPLAAAFILALSAVAWLLIYQGGRALWSLLG
jgi:hypothetical protein